MTVLVVFRMLVDVQRVIVKERTVETPGHCFLNNKEDENSRDIVLDGNYQKVRSIVMLGRMSTYGYRVGFERKGRPRSYNKGQ